MTVPPLPYAAPAVAEVPDKPARVMPANGRPKGSMNRLTKTIKDAILYAAMQVGDDWAEAAAEKGEFRPSGIEGYLTMVAASDPKTFCALLGRVLPMEVTGADGGPLQVTFRTVYEDDGSNSGGSAPLTIDHV